MKNLFKVLTLAAMCSLAACSNTDTHTNTSRNTETTTDETSAVSEAERQALTTTVFYFAFDSSTLSSQDQATLKYHAARLRAIPNNQVRLEGHASEEGTREYNLALGERRARSIASFLMANGVSGQQLEVISYGEELPADAGSTETARSKNRRVEIK
jgi:peptidoglycan-associated lipoprotein